MRLLLLSALFPACTDSDLRVIPHLDAYDVGYMLYPSSIVMPRAKQNHVTLQYNHRGMPARRTGHLIPAPPFTGYDLQFTDKVFDEVVYHGEDRITISKKDELPDVDIPTDQKEIILVRGRISRIIHTRGDGSSETKDTTDFHYDGAGLLLRTTRKFYRQAGGSYWLRARTTRDYTFTNKNLVKIEGVEVRNSGTTTSTIDLFEDYDNAPNPTRGLIFFDEIFHRSLSSNNFRKYSFRKYDGEGQIISAQNKTWTFQYDEKGMPIYH